MEIGGGLKLMRVAEGVKQEKHPRAATRISVIGAIDI
jgi:hypothetical protein